ncbi:MAG TPA: OmpA family protein [Candidatus Avamphibacillus sp.]|nr:OmpA family protein [Candidatus Avamphibacillus sp.]
MFIDPSTKPHANEKTSVDEDGSFQMDLLFSDFSNHDFTEYYNGREIEVLIEVKMTEHSQPDEVKELYGKNGENFKGPFTYQYDRLDELYQKVSTSVYVEMGANQKIYDIQTPERIEIPNDYGDSNLWIDTEEITNDHKYFYIQGKFNLIEGMALTGGYYSNKGKMAQGGHENRTYIQPDGTFLQRIAYESFIGEGFIWIRSWAHTAHLTDSLLNEAYGENFEYMEGEDVIYNEKDERKEIEIILNPLIPELEAPNETDITEEDGEIKVQVPDDVLFDFDKSDLKAEAKETLEEVITILESLEEGTNIHINGHTDNQGSADYNMELSEKRAFAVEEYLEDSGDLSHLDVTTKGYGKTKPIASNEDKEGQQRNRRVEIVINANEADNEDE